MSSQIGGWTIDQATQALRPWQDRAAPIGAVEYAQRLNQARRLMSQHGFDALLVTAGASLRYFCGVSWGLSERLVALLITTEDDPVMICPAFETGSLSHELLIPADVRVWEEHENPSQLVASALNERKASRLALDPAAPMAVFAQLQLACGSVAIADASTIIDGCRMRKSAAELALMKQATAMTLEIHRVVARMMHVGITTTAVKQFIDQAHRTLGADGGSTFCIVQFGQATAYPHGIPGEQRLRENDLILIDTGCSVHGYNSDITRTYAFGQPDPEHCRIWDLELRAQLAAFNAARPGVECAAVDQAARDVLEQAGLGPDYKLPGLPHRTGHGCGLSIHETPYLVRGNATLLEPGMCCSNEPMIVVPEQFGIRLEDHFYITETGAEWFTQPSVAIDQPFAT